MESTLSLTYFDYRGEVGEYLGYGRGDEGDNSDTAWTDQQSTNVNKIVAAGQRQFYFPPPLEGERNSHEWSFLRPVGTVTLESGDSEVLLPADFGDAEGEIAVSTTSSSVYAPVRLTGIGLVRAKLVEAPDDQGHPRWIALEALRGTHADQGQRHKLVVFPVADANYTLTFRYQLLPDAITGAKPYSYGGMQHVETVLASCLERAEFFRMNAKGVCWSNWQERLAASISNDRRRRPVDRGRNVGDHWETGNRVTLGTVTINGADPE